jgi:hypothetical protein
MQHRLDNLECTQKKVYFVLVGDVEVLTAVTVNSTISRDVMLCNPVEIYIRFIGSKDKPSKELARSVLLAACLAYSSTLKMEGVRSSDASLNVYRTTRSHPRCTY